MEQELADDEEFNEDDDPAGALSPPEEKTTPDFRRPRNHAQQLARIQMDFYMVIQELLIEDARLESEDEPYAQDPSGESQEAFSPIDLSLFAPEDEADDDEEGAGDQGEDEDDLPEDDDLANPGDR
jgi:hypothetical protein